ncbi:MAG: hypothetical protein ACRDVK_04965 [Acidimicrobiia bacterium]
MRSSKMMALLSTTYLDVAGAGTWVAVSRDLAARPFGIVSGLPVIQSFAIGLGTALSAPLAPLLLLIVLNAWLLRSGERRPIQLIMILAGGFLVGMLAEPILGEVLGGGHDLAVTILVAANVVVPLAMLAYGLTASPRVAG